ncbi:isoprenylcysteine carboxylmethyltransferase family protein [Ekhidna sp.]|uniref:methyltransferase family protein n=1 Tax=Ekhidna sp. TaxID=2608089 RepID=UPI0032971B5D
MKLKIPPVIVFFLALAMVFGGHYFFAVWSYQFPNQTFISRIFLAAGVLIAFSGIIKFRMKGTTVDPLHPDKATALVSTGIYRYTRNPMYLGMALVLLGGIIRVGNVVGISGLLFFVWYLTQFQVKPEEEALLEIFKDEYKSYCAKVRRWI